MLSIVASFSPLFICVIELLNLLDNVIGERSEGLAVAKVQLQLDPVISGHGARLEEQPNESVDAVHHLSFLFNLPQHRPSHDQANLRTGSGGLLQPTLK